MDAVGRILMALVDRARPQTSLATLLCEEVVARMPVSGVSLVVMTPEGARAMVAAAGPYAAALEDIAFVTGEGPSVDAFDQGRLVLAADLVGRTDWPAYSAAALGLGVAAVFALPVQIGGIRLGVLELHHTEPGALGEVDLTRGLRFLDAAALVLMHGEELEPWSVSETAEQMSGVQAAVHQATGMVSVQAAVGLGEALLLLRGRAFADERPLQDVASDVTSRLIRFERPGSNDRDRE